MTTAPNVPQRRRLLLRAPGLEAWVEDRTGACVVLLVGELDIAAAPELGLALATLPPTDQLIFDTGRLRFIDAAGLRLLAGAQRRLPSGGRLTLLAAGPMLRRLIPLAGLEGRLMLAD